MYAKYLLPITALVPIGAIDSDSRADWPYVAGSNIFVSPAIADVDGDGTLDVVIADWNGKVHCIGSDGTPMWIAPLINEPMDLKSSPALVDLTGDGLPEVILGTGQVHLWGRLYVLRGTDGTTLATFDTPTAIVAPPLVADFNGDGLIEIVFGHMQYQGQAPANLFCVTARTVDRGELSLSLNWKISHFGGSMFEAPAAADLDGDNDLEIIAPLGGIADTSAGTGAILAFQHNSKVLWVAEQTPKMFDPNSPINQTPFIPFYHTPVVSDLDSDGKPDVLLTPAGGVVRRLNGLSGATVFSYGTRNQGMQHSASVADLNLDGTAEILLGLQSGGERLVCMSAEGPSMWRYEVSGNTDFACPSIGDVDGDGQLEIAFGTGANNPGGAPGMYLFKSTGELVWYRQTPSVVYSTPALADFDGDGTLEIAFGCYDGKLYVLSENGEDFEPPTVLTPPDLAPWPMFKQNIERTGSYPGPP